ncbi:MAG: aspartate-semialdehyde dehydrogenase [bacterium]
MYDVAVVGATGLVGREMVSILEKRDFPVRSLRLLATSRSQGMVMQFKGKDIVVEEAKPENFKGIQIALFSAGEKGSKEFSPEAVKSGAIVIDNSNAFRMEPNVPLVVPEVNEEKLKEHKGIIANPNCSTIQMVVALAPIHRKYKIRRIVVSTYQSVSGTGREAIDELWEETKNIVEDKPIIPKVYPHQIAFNLLPHIDIFYPNGYSKEEMKMVNETRKILNDQSIRICATTVRVPVFRAHSESVNIETESPITPEEVRDLLSKSPGIVVMDKPEECIYPMPILAEGRDEVFVGRIRRDESIENGIAMWIVSDNIRKGAALNAVQIAESLIKLGLV